MDQNTLYDVLIGIDQAGSSQEMNKTLKEIAKSLDIKDIPVRIGSKNLLVLTDSIRQAMLKGLNVPEDHVKKIGKQWANHLQNSMSAIDLKSALGVDVLGKASLPKNFFGGGQLNNLKGELGELSKTYNLSIQSFSKNAKDQISVLVSGLDALGNKTSFILKDSGEGFKKVSTVIKSEFDSMFATQLKTIDGFGNKIATAMKKVEANPNSATYKKDLNDLNIGYQVLLNNLKDVANFNQYDTEAAKSAKMQKIATADLINQKQVQRQVELSAEAAVSAAQTEGFNKQKGYIKQLQVAISTGNAEEEQEVRRLMGLNAQSFQEEKNYVAQIDALKNKAESKGNETFAAKTEADLRKALTSVGNFSKNYTESLEKNSKVSKDFELRLEELQKDIVKYDKSIDLLESKNLISKEQAANLRNYTTTLKDLTDKSKLAEIAAENLANQYGQIITPKTKADTGALIKNFLDAEKGSTKAAEAMKNLSSHLIGTGKATIDARKDATNYNNIVQVLTASFTDNTGKAQKLSYAYNQVTGELHLMKVETPIVGKQVKGLGEQIKAAAGKIAMWGVSTKIVYGVWNAFKQGITVIKELDKELTQIAVVQGMSRESVKQLGAEYADTAIKMRTSVVEVAKLNTELVRQGLSIEESAERADTILKLSAAGMISVEQSLAVITSGVNALGVAHEKIADVLLKAANITASDVEGLGEAFTKTASGAKAAGLSIEETTALLATMKDVTQEGDSQLGTSLKSILARFNKINEETGLMNEDLNETQTAIESVGVAFTDSHGQIRNFYDIVGDLSLIWDDLDKNTQSYIATQAAGTRQQNRFFAIMQNFNQVQGVHNDLLSSAGTLQDAYSIYLQGTEASTKKLKASLEAMWVKAINSDWLSFFADVASGVVNLISQLGVFSTALSVIVAKFTILSAMKAGGFGKELTGVFVGFTKAAAGAIKMGGGVTTVLGNIGTSALAAGTGISTAIGPLLPAIATFALIAGAIFVVTKVWSDASEAARKYAGEQAELFKQAKDLQTQEFTNKATLEKLGEEYISLNKRVKDAGGTYTLSAEESARYYEVQKEIFDILPNLSKSTDEYGRVILHQVDNVNALTSSYDALAKAKVTEAAVKSDELLKGNSYNFNASENGKRLIELQRKDNPNNRNSLGLMAEEIVEMQKLLLEKGAQDFGILAIKLIDQYGEIPVELNAILSSNPVKIKLAEASDKEKYAILTEIVDFYKTKEIPIIIGAKKSFTLAGIKTEIEGINEELEKGFINQTEYDKKIDSIGKGLSDEILRAGNGLSEEGKLAIQDFIDFIPNIRLKIASELDLTEEELAVQAAERLKQFQDSKAAYSDLTSEVKKYGDQLNSLATKSQNDPEVYAMLQQEHSELLRFYGDEGRLIEEITKKQDALKEQQAEAYATMMYNDEDYRASKESGWDTLTENIKTLYGIDLASYANAQEAKDAINSKVLGKLDAGQREHFRLTKEGYILQGTAYEELLKLQKEGSFAEAADATAKIAALKDQLGPLNAEYFAGAGKIEAYNNQLRVKSGLLVVDTSLIEENAAAQKMLNESTSDYSEARSEMEELIWLQDKLNTGKISELELRDTLVANYPELLQYMGNEKAMNRAIEEAIHSRKETLIDSYLAMLLASGELTSAQAVDYKTLFDYLVKGYGLDKENFANLAEVKFKIEQKLIEVLGKNWQEYYKIQNGKLTLQVEMMRRFQSESKIAGQGGDTGTVGVISNELDKLVSKMNALNKSPINLNLFKASEFLKNDFNKLQDYIAASKKAAEAALKGLKSKLAAEKKVAADAAAAAAKAKRDAANKKAAAAAKKAADAAKKAKEDELKATNDLIKATNELIKANNEYMKSVQDTTKEVFDFALEYFEWVEEEKKKVLDEAYNVDKKNLEDSYEQKEKALEDEKEAQLEILEIKEKATAAEEAALQYLKDRQALQDNLANLEYQYALASLDNSTDGIQKRRTLEESLAEEKEALLDLESERIKTIEEEALATRRQMIENENAYKMALLETLKQKELADLETAHTAKIAKLEEQYSAENNYLNAKQAVQTGMIQSLTGEMVPLRTAFEQLTKATGEFWTFFGQQEVQDFGSKVESVLEYTKRLGLETIQVWKEVALQAEIATGAINTANSASTSSGSGSGSTPSNSSSPTTSSAGSTPKTAPAPTGTSLSTKVKAMQNFINRAAAFSPSDAITKVGVTGKFSSETTRELRDVIAKFFAPGKRFAYTGLQPVLSKAATNQYVTETLYKKLANYRFTPPTNTSGVGYNPYDAVTRSINTPLASSYSKGGKIDYTGPAVVHGTKDEPEYVFNYPQFKDLAKMIATNQFTRKDLTAQPIPPRIELNIKNLINVEGNMTKDVMPEFKRVSQDAMKELTRTMKGWGK